MYVMVPALFSMLNNEKFLGSHCAEFIFTLEGEGCLF